MAHHAGCIALIQVGLRMAGWGDDQIKYFLIGNPVIWWGSTVSIVLWMLVLAGYIVQRKRKVQMFATRGIRLPYPDQWEDFLFAGSVGVGGWALHYFPFWIMGRVCYLHHYFPALYFGILVMTHLIDHTLGRVGPRVRDVGLLTVLAIVTAVFFYFAQFSFGFTGSSSRFESRRWLSTWKF